MKKSTGQPMGIASRRGSNHCTAFTATLHIILLSAAVAQAQHFWQQPQLQPQPQPKPRPQPPQSQHHTQHVHKPQWPGVSAAVNQPGHVAAAPEFSQPNILQQPAARAPSQNAPPAAPQVRDKSCGRFARRDTGLGILTRGLPRRLYDCRSSAIGTVPFGQFQRIWIRMTWNIVLPVNQAGRAKNSVLYWNTSIVFDQPIQVGRVDGSTLVGNSAGSGGPQTTLGAPQTGSIPSPVQRFEGTSSFKTFSGFTAPLVSFTFEYYSDGLTAQSISTVQGVVVACDGCETILYLRPSEPPTGNPSQPRTPSPAAPGWGGRISDLSGPRTRMPPDPKESNPGPDLDLWTGHGDSRPGDRNDRRDSTGKQPPRVAQDSGVEEDGGGGGSNSGGTVAGVTITLLLLAVLAAIGYCVYKRRKENESGEDNSNASRTWKGSLSLLAANVWLTLSRLKDRIFPDAKNASNPTSSLQQAPRQASQGHQTPQGPGQHRPPRRPYPVNNIATPLGLTSAAGPGASATLDRYDDVVLTSAGSRVENYGSNGSTTSYYDDNQPTVIDYEDVRPDDTVATADAGGYNEESHYG